MNELNIDALSEEQLKEALEKKRKAKKETEKQLKDQYMIDKNTFLRDHAEGFLAVNSELKKLKKTVIIEASKLYDRMYEVAGKEPKDTKSFTLKDETDNIKLIVEKQERFEFTEEAAVHISAIKEIFRDKFANRNKAMYNLLDSLLIKGSKGEYDPKLLAKARRQVRELGDDNLIEEFDKLDECQKVVGTSSYCRLYVKNENGRWEDVSLNFSSL